MVEQVIEFAVEKTIGLVVRLSRPVWMPISNMYNFKSNYDQLKKDAEELGNKLQSVLDEVEKAESRGDMIKDEVLRWLDEVEEFTKQLTKVPRELPDQSTLKGVEGESATEDVEEADRQADTAEEKVRELLGRVKEFNARLESITTKGEEEKRKKRRLKGLAYSNLKTRFDHSMEVVKLDENVAALLEKEKKIKDVGKLNRLQRRESMYMRNYEAFESRESIFEEIMETLENTKVKMIGLHGMGGVGKTTLVNKVYWHAHQEKLFDRVVMAEVKQNPDLKAIQGKMAGDLDLIFQEQEDVRERAVRLRKKFENKSVLVILDDVWEELDLEAIGIPSESAEKITLQQTGDQKGQTNDRRQCRILLTSRDAKVCEEMKTEKYIHVMPLLLKEATELFWKTLGFNSEKQAEFLDIAEKIVKRCAGSPIAIKAIAKLLQHGGLSVWNDALISLERMNFASMEVSVIELSYKFLKNEDAKSLFLLCSLHEVGGSIHFDSLVRYVLGLGLFQYANTIKAVREKVEKLIKDLKDANLLLDDGRKDRVKMHDIIHGVAQRIASRQKLMFNVQDVADLEEELEKDMYKDSTAISLPFMDVSELPKMPEFPQLKLFLLFMRGQSLKIPDPFFDRMKELRVLNLTSVDLSSMTPSLGHLTNLRTLCLEHCQLGDITLIGKLQKLVVLSLSDSDIRRLPKEIGELTRLRLLDLRGCSQLKMIPPNVLSNLTRLEELYTGDGFVRWDVEGRDNASLLELKQLDRLTNLEIHVMDAHNIPLYLFSEKLERYVIFIGNVGGWCDGYQTLRVLKLQFNSKGCLGHGVKMLLTTTEDLYLDKLNGFKNVHPELGGKGFPHLKHLQVQNDPEMLHISKVDDRDCYNVFLQLESLHLSNLVNLREICCGQLRGESFSKLKTIKAEKCHALMHVISLRAIKTFLHLQEIEVSDCENLKGIFGKNSEEDRVQITKIGFPELHSLTLKRLSSFTNFGHVTSIGTSEIEEEHEDLTSLFDEKVSCPSLKNLNLTSLKIKRVWCDASSFSQTLTSLVVEKCHNLKSLLSSSMVNNLLQLENLKIADCESVEVIIDPEGSEQENGVNEISFPNLMSLELHGLQTLTSFGSANLVKFPLLKQLRIGTCPNLTGFLSGSAAKSSERTKRGNLLDEKVVLPALKELKLSSINIEKIWLGQLLAQSASFQHLTTIVVDGCDGLVALLSTFTAVDKKHKKVYGFKSLRMLEVRNCKNLAYLFTPSMASSLVRLRKVEIENCATMVEVIKKGDRDATGANTLFPELHSLYLKCLPKLQRFCSFPGNVIELSSLSHLEIENCPKMKMNSNDLQINHGPRMKTNSEENRHAEMTPLFDEKISLPNLRTLQISSMDTLRKLWHNRLSPTSFCKLQELSILACCNLLNVFPQSMFQRLKRLESLKISDCDSLEEIFYMMESINPSFEFPELTSLKLQRLASLTKFYSGLHISEWPLLRKLVVIGCGKVEIFASEFRSVHVEYQNISIPKPFFIVKEGAFPRLEKLKLVENDILKEIWHGEFSGDPLRLKILELRGIPKITKFPSHFINREPALEELIVSNAYFTEVFSCEDLGSEKAYAHALSQLKVLKLLKLPRLSHIWEENMQPIKNFQNVISLIVAECDSLKYLVPSWVSFKNLTALRVAKCNKLINLLTYLTAKSLQQLTNMDISDCEMIEEIITLPKDGANGGTVFSQLQYLRLSCLPSLTGFYLGIHTLEFPSLNILIVEQCPNMKVFSRGDLITPKLQKVQLNDDRRWDSDLNNTIQKMFKDMVGFHSIEILKLSKFPHLKEMWHSELPVSFFHRLRELWVNECTNISSAIPVNTLLFLKSLKTFTVKDCDSLEEVFHLEGFSDSYSRLLPDVTVFHLIELPRLKNIWSESHLKILGFINLTELYLQKCNSLRYIFTTNVMLGLVQLREVTVIDCAMVNEIIRQDREMDAAENNIIFTRLNSIFLESLPNLTCFYSGRKILQCRYLKKITVTNCPKMKILFTSTEGLDLHYASLFGEKIVQSV